MDNKKCQNCKNYATDKELYIGKCTATDRPTMMNDVCGCYERKEEENE